MPLSQYLLLALLATGGVALPDGNAGASAKTLGADAIAQPNGGAMTSAYPGQETPKKEDSHIKRLSKTRHGRKGKITHHRARTRETPKKDGGAQ